MAETALCLSPVLMVAVAIGLGHEVVAVAIGLGHEVVAVAIGLGHEVVAVSIGLGHEVVAVSKDISDASELAGELVGIVAVAMKGQATAVLDLNLEMTTPS